MRRALVLALLGATALTTVIGCTKPTTPPGEARVHLDDGDRLDAKADGGSYGRVADGTLLARDTAVRAVAGEPELEMAGGLRVVLAPETEARVDDPLFIERGDALARSTRPAVVATHVARVRADGLVRISQLLGASVRVYQGEAMVTSSGRSLNVGARRETAVPAEGLVARRATPTGWRSDDAWDLRYLGAVIDLDDALQTQARGFGRQAPDASIDDVAVLLGVSADALRSATARRSLSEALIGGAIATVGSTPVPSVFGLRDDGAAWGVVAVERAGGDPARAVDLVRAAIARWVARVADAAASARTEPGPAVTAAGAAVQSPTAPPGTGSATVGGAGSSSTTVPAPTSTTVPLVTVPTLPPVTIPSAPTVPTTTVPIGDTVGGVVDGLLGS